jgi:CheY-like chemotaxis protein
VVDDEEIMRNLFTDILEDEGYKVTTVSDGKKAQDKVKEEFFDIAFVDVHMPVIDGIKTIRILKEITPKTAIVMTDSLPDYMLKGVKKEGAIACIHKPFDIREVRSIIIEIMERSRENG